MLSIISYDSQVDLSRFESALQSTIKVPSTVGAMTPLESQSPKASNSTSTHTRFEDEDDDI